MDTFRGAQHYLEGYNTRRPHQGRGMNARTPSRAFNDGIPKTSNTEVTIQTKNCQNQTRLRSASNAVTVKGIS
jgi:hypothetical protein